jgi:hypothetical protein
MRIKPYFIGEKSSFSIGFDKALEELIAQNKQLFPSMKHFSKARQCSQSASLSDHLINGGV